MSNFACRVGACYNCVTLASLVLLIGIGSFLFVFVEASVVNKGKERCCKPWIYRTTQHIVVYVVIYVVMNIRVVIDIPLSIIGWRLSMFVKGGSSKLMALSIELLYLALLCQPFQTTPDSDLLITEVRGGDSNWCQPFSCFFAYSCWSVVLTPSVMLKNTQIIHWYAEQISQTKNYHTNDAFN